MKNQIDIILKNEKQSHNLTYSLKHK